MKKRFNSMFVSILSVTLLASASALAANTASPKAHWVHRTHKPAAQSAQPALQQGHPKPHWVMRSHPKVSNAQGGMPSGMH